jgi:hypothetical protein
MLQRLAERWTIFGNSAEAVARAKDPATLAEICGRLAIPHPRWSCEEPAAGWLRKLRGGAGGAHVRPGGVVPPPSPTGEGDHAENGGGGKSSSGGAWPSPPPPRSAVPLPRFAGEEQACASDDSREPEQHYWQEAVAGAPVAALVLANGAEAVLLGFTAQWCDPAADAPFRYGGAVRPAILEAAVETQLDGAARAVVEDLALVGLNSVDFLVDEGSWSLIEVNPRPGATLDVFEPDAKLFAMHMNACAGNIPSVAARLPGAAAAAIVYARETLEIVPAIAWPDWTADRQRPGTVLPEGAPICTVLARADHPRRARQIARERCGVLQEMLGASPVRRRAAR